MKYLKSNPAFVLAVLLTLSASALVAADSGNGNSPGGADPGHRGGHRPPPTSTPSAPTPIVTLTPVNTTPPPAQHTPTPRPALPQSAALLVPSTYDQARWEWHQEGEPHSEQHQAGFNLWFTQKYRVPILHWTGQPLGNPNDGRFQSQLAAANNNTLPGEKEYFNSGIGEDFAPRGPLVFCDTYYACNYGCPVMTQVCRVDSCPPGTRTACEANPADNHDSCVCR